MSLQNPSSAVESIIDWFMGNNITNSSSASPLPGTGSPTKRRSSSKTQLPLSPSTGTGTRTTPPLSRSQTSYKCGYKPSELPHLKWSWKVGEKIDPTTVYSASKRLSRQMILAEDLLVGLFPGLTINLQHPLGMSCPGYPNKPCPLKRPLTLDEILDGWDIGNTNKYTTICYECGKEFVPRFTVECRSKNWIGNEGSRTPLWCELLSPWTLRKEVFTILFEEGVDHLISPSFRHPSLSQQHAVLFWNTIIALRLRGLPYSFMLCGQSITSAFPPPPTTATTTNNSTTTATSHNNIHTHTSASATSTTGTVMTSDGVADVYTTPSPDTSPLHIVDQRPFTA